MSEDRPVAAGHVDAHCSDCGKDIREGDFVYGFGADRVFHEENCKIILKGCLCMQCGLCGRKRVQLRLNK